MCECGLRALRAVCAAGCVHRGLRASLTECLQRAADVCSKGKRNGHVVDRKYYRCYSKDCGGADVRLSETLSLTRRQGIAIESLQVDSSSFALASKTVALGTTVALALVCVLLLL